MKSPENYRIDYSIHYRNFHNDSDAHYENRAKAMMGALEPYLPDNKNLVILDIGCGMGFSMVALKKMGYRQVYGVDIDEQQIAAAKKRNLQVYHITDLIKFLQDHLDLYDVIIMQDVLEHIPIEKQIPIMRHVFLSLKYSGIVILTVPNASSPFALRWKHIDFTHHSSFTEYSLDFVLKNAGFNKVVMPASTHVSYPPPVRFWRYGWKKRFRKWLTRFLWKQMFLAEFPSENIQKISFDLNLIAIANKEK